MLRQVDIENFSPYLIPSVLRHNIPVYGYSLNDLEPRGATLGPGFYDNDIVYFIGVIAKATQSRTFSDEKCAYFIDTKRNNLIWINHVSLEAFNFVENKDIDTNLNKYVVLRHDDVWVEADRFLIQYYKKKLGIGE